MNAQLTPTLKKFVEDCLKGGRYNNRSEVIRAGLRLLMDQEQPKPLPQTEGDKGDNSSRNDGRVLKKSRARTPRVRKRVGARGEK